MHACSLATWNSSSSKQSSRWKGRGSVFHILTTPRLKHSEHLQRTLCVFIYAIVHLYWHSKPTNPPQRHQVLILEPGCVVLYGLKIKRILWMWLRILFWGDVAIRRGQGTIWLLCRVSRAWSIGAQKTIPQSIELWHAEYFELRDIGIS
jgi:hypothetical protein